ncbi:MAG: cation-translocating P-type ATPase [Pseudomonadales bacterium]|nr:cation-translocating P-type ATPase [Pseudomonadales bacterium]
MKVEWGLTSAQAQQKLKEIGLNRLPESKGAPLWLRFLGQFNSPLIFILLFALVFDAGVWAYESFKGFPVELVSILVILLLNAFLGMWQEAKSENALAKLKAMAAPHSYVIRDGRLVQLPSDVLVPDDVVRIEAGERLPADGVILEARSFSVDESVVTGESVPIEKAEKDQLLAGTLAVRGSAFYRVTATGQQSNMGQLAYLLTEVKSQKTPLEIRLDTFGRKVAVFVILLAILVFTVGLSLQGLGAFSQLFLFAVALAVAAVPESLPAVLTLAMALGVERMASRKAIVKRLTAVEALGSVTVIATDKTGTLTENKMRVERMDCLNDQQAYLAMILANDADAAHGVGDPLEIGLLNFAEENQCEVAKVRAQYTRVHEIPFDSQWKYMSVAVQDDSDNGITSYLKGAPDILLEHSQLSSQEKSDWQQRIESYNAEGYRTLALASYGGLINNKLAAADCSVNWLGVVLLWDPPRQEIPGSIKAAQAAGIRVVMITGDHPATAHAIAQRIGIHSGAVYTGADLEQVSLADAVQNAAVFARVSPENKLAIVRALKAQGDVVAVTGDGVNDAPALKSANVGVAMGTRGSDVSREVADLVLMDDNFATIVTAIEEGRSIYENIQKFIRTLFSTNLTEVLLIVIGAMFAFYYGAIDGALLLPLTAVQILWVNLLTDSLPALAITTDKNPGVMNQTPRSPASPLLDRSTWLFVLMVGLLGGGVALALLWQLPAMGYSFDQVQTMVFCYLVWVQLSFVLPARRVNMESVSNVWVLGALAAASLAQLIIVTVPGFQVFFGLGDLPLVLWLVLVLILLGSWLLAHGCASWIQNSSNNTND